MTFLQSILLGLIQGVAEFLPISSSGHLAIAQNLLHINAEVPAFYDVLLHLGTLVAVFVAYWQDICDMVREFFCGIGDLVHHSTPTPVPPARRLILLIILGTLPLFAILPIKDTVEGLKSSMVFIGTALIVTGSLLVGMAAGAALGAVGTMAATQNQRQVKRTARKLAKGAERAMSQLDTMVTDLVERRMDL